MPALHLGMRSPSRPSGLSECSPARTLGMSPSRRYSGDASENVALEEGELSAQTPSPTPPSTQLSKAGDGTGTTSAPARITRRRSTSSALTLGQNHFPLLSSIVKSKKFEIFIGVVIVANCTTMGLEAELLLGRAQNTEAFVAVFEHFITAIFLVELLLRILVFGWRSFAPLPGTLWNFLDAFFLVFLTGVLVVWILPVLGVSSGGSTLQTLTVLRALRLARLVRVVQRFKAFHEVWLLLRGLMESGRVLFWTIVVIFFITYMFAVFGVVLLGVPIKNAYQASMAANDGSSDELEELLKVTGGVWPLMYTLIQVLTLDSWNAIARPMMTYVPWCWAFFYLYIAIAVIVMMNLVTAVIVENALKNSQKDAKDLLMEKEAHKQTELARFQKVFEQMDMDGDGELSWPEFESSFEDKELSAQLRLLGVEPGNCKEIFNMLDTGDGVLSVKEFFDGIGCMDGPAQAKELLRTNKTADLAVKLICQQNMELREDLDQLLRLTPGAVMRQRQGSLKHRARRHQSSDNIFHTTSGSGNLEVVQTIASSPSSVIGESNGSCRMEQVDLSDVLQRLDQVAAMMHESRQESKEALASCNMNLGSCNEKVLSLNSDMCELKSNLGKALKFPPQPSWEIPASVAENSTVDATAHWRTPQPSSAIPTPRADLMQGACTPSDTSTRSRMTNETPAAQYAIVAGKSHWRKDLLSDRIANQLPLAMPQV